MTRSWSTRRIILACVVSGVLLVGFVAGLLIPRAPGGDVDCAGGGGDGPRFVVGPTVIDGPDIWGLDRDGNGVGCE